MSDRLLSGLDMLASVREGRAMVDLMQKLAPDRLRQKLDRSSELYRAFATLDSDTKFTVFKAAVDASRMSHILYDLITSGAVASADIDGLRDGSRAIRTVDYHVPGASEEANNWLELRMRYVAIKMATMEWHAGVARFEETAAAPNLDVAERNRVLASTRAAEIDRLIEEIQVDIKRMKQ